MTSLIWKKLLKNAAETYKSFNFNFEKKEAFAILLINYFEIPAFQPTVQM